MHRHEAFGAVPLGSGSTRFSLWALGRSTAAVEVEGLGTFDLEPGSNGHFAAEIAGVGAGARYWFRIEGGPRLPDLASRCQPDGNDGASMVVDADFDWTDADWAGVAQQDQVLYELHVGTFTQAGTWQAASLRLEALRDL